jgi:endogenous inhibitor of DNA gyrase (YacG/DUF329 family)
MLALPEWLKDISVKANRGRTRALMDGLSGTTLWTPPEPVYRKLVNKRQRGILTDEAAALLKRGKLSPFEYEASVRAGLRLRFISEGHGWAHSDLEADAIVQAAFTTMGIERPTWEQGQPNATTGPDYCQTCYSPLDDADQANHRRFCSDTCAKVMKSQDWERWYKLQHGVMNHAKYLDKLDEIPDRPCTVCGTGFRSLNPDTVTCSPECTGIAKRTVPEKKCQHCVTRFRPHSITKAGAFCSKSCADQSRRLKPRTCPTCSSSWTPKDGRERYCSTACKPGLPEIPCGHCGDLFNPPTKRARFCTRICKDRNTTRRRAIDAEAARSTLRCDPA